MSALKAVVIGYGNTLRQDDGAGPRVAERIAELGIAGVTSLSVHQLTPELAAPLADAEVAVFVDASVNPSRTRTALSEVLPPTRGDAANHAAAPGDLLSLAQLAYGRSPRAWLIEIPARRLGFGEDLSEEALAGVEEALQIALSILEGEHTDA